jgi:hypothetical protein
MHTKLIVIASALTLVAATALAQQTDPKVAGVGPQVTKEDCDRQAPAADAKMSKAEFDAACAKLRERTQKTQ